MGGYSKTLGIIWNLNTHETLCCCWWHKQRLSVCQVLTIKCLHASVVLAACMFQNSFKLQIMIGNVHSLPRYKIVMLLHNCKHLIVGRFCQETVWVMTNVLFLANNDCIQLHMIIADDIHGKSVSILSLKTKRCFIIFVAMQLWPMQPANTIMLVVLVARI